MNYKSDRQLALIWWNTLSIIEKRDFAREYFDKKPDLLIQKEIEEIWNIENNVI